MKTITLITALQCLAQCLLVGSLMAITGTTQAMERVTYYHNDALGSPVAATDATGTLLWREEYTPYGERLKKEASSKDTLWYTGKQEEATFGINYFGARWYDPQIGRFMGVDPVGFDPDNIHSFSKYAYANNNPYVYVDPDGNLPILVPLAIAIAKEIGGELASHYLGVPLSSRAALKAGVKGVGKQLAKTRTRRDVSKKGLGGNPFKGKKPEQIDKMLRNKGFDVKGKDPVSGKGSYINPKSGRKYYIDKGGKYKKGAELPHVDVHRLCMANYCLCRNR